MTFATGWQGHAIQVIFIGDYILIANQGQHRKEAAIQVFKIDRERPKLEHEDILKLHNANLPSAEGASYFYETLPALLGFDESKQDLISQVMIRACRQGNQKMGNCSWLNNKSGVLGLFTLYNLLKARAYYFSSEKMREQAYLQIAAISRRVYKSYSVFSKLEILKQYVERPKNTVDWDHALVAKVVNKLNAEKWQYLRQEEGFYKREEINQWLDNYRKEFHLN